MYKKYFLTFFAVLGFLLLAAPALARDPQTITDWYVKNFNASIIVNKDSSLLVTENITADAGNLPDKHGIFRVLPTQVNTDKGVFKTPIELISITDFNGNPYNYRVLRDNFAKTVTWKIGDADKTVIGENNYRIIYKVKNALRFGSPDFDELYWNISGNFWDIDIDNFSGTITFPGEVNQQNVVVFYYTGVFGSTSHDLATYQWIENNTLFFSSIGTLKAGEGITASVTFPKNIFTPYQMSFFEKYADALSYLFFLIPLIMFIAVFWVWQRYGKDPKMRRPIPPEFGIPQTGVLAEPATLASRNKITPMQMGVVLRHGVWNNKLITASIIDLAVRKFLIIQEVENKMLFIKIKDYKLIKAENYKNIDTLTPPEKVLLSALFGDSDTVNLSNIKISFAKNVSLIKAVAIADVVEKGWIIKSGNILMGVFIALAVALVWGGFIFVIFISMKLFLALALSAMILLIFGVLMPKRTQAGVDLLFKIKGFELYMKQAEDYRQQFYEKENIFDKFLPYAVVFGITKLWAKKMEIIYGPDFYKNYHPVWFVGAGLGNFDADSFTSQLNGIVSGITSGTGTASGAGGGGFSGGGGGGGGGGGW